MTRVATEADLGVTDAQRFTLELEFVSCLANPRYVNYLAQSKLLADPALLAYLQYLQYWLQPPYARFVSYPAALDMLRHLQSPVFRATMANPDATEHVWRQTFFQWQFAMRGLQAQQAEPYAAVAEAEGAAGATLEQTQAAAEPGAVAQAPPAVAAAVEAGAVGSERAAPAAGEKRKRDDS